MNILMTDRLKKYMQHKNVNDIVIYVGVCNT